MLMEEGFGKDVLSFVKLDKFNRPYIDKNIDFNITHSGDFVLCAVSNKSRIGIDIEEIKDLKIEEFSSILSIEEQKSISAHFSPIDAFFKVWTQKEAIIKANGKGLGIEMSEVIITNDTAECENQTWYLQELKINSNYSSHVAFKRKSEVILKELTINNFL